MSRENKKRYDLFLKEIDARMEAANQREALAKNKIERVKEEAAQMERRIQETESEVKGTKEGIKQLEDTVEKLTDKMDALNKEIEKIEKTKTWGEKTLEQQRSKAKTAKLSEYLELELNKESVGKEIFSQCRHLSNLEPELTVLLQDSIAKRDLLEKELKEIEEELAASIEEQKETEAAKARGPSSEEAEGAVVDFFDHPEAIARAMAEHAKMKAKPVYRKSKVDEEIQMTPEQRAAYNFQMTFKLLFSVCAILVPGTSKAALEHMVVSQSTADNQAAFFVDPDFELMPALSTKVSKFRFFFDLIKEGSMDSGVVTVLDIDVAMGRLVRERAGAMQMNQAFEVIQGLV